MSCWQGGQSSTIGDFITRIAEACAQTKHRSLLPPSCETHGTLHQCRAPTTAQHVRKLVRKQVYICTNREGTIYQNETSVVVQDWLMDNHRGVLFTNPLPAPALPAAMVVIVPVPA